MAFVATERGDGGGIFFFRSVLFVCVGMYGVEEKEAWGWE